MINFETQIQELAHRFIKETDGKGDVSQFADYLGKCDSELEEKLTIKQIASVLQEEMLKYRLKKESSIRVKVNKKKTSQPAVERANSQYHQIFRYLKDLYAIIRKTVIDVHRYPEYFYVRDLPQTEGLKLYGQIKEGILMEVDRVTVPEPPEPSEDIKSWLKGDFRNPFNELEMYETITVDDGQQTITPFLMKITVQSWIQTKWQPWANVAGPKQKVHNLYRKLFLLAQRLDKEEDLELVWGQGMLYWKQIRHPVLTAKVYLNFDDVSGKIRIVPGLDAAPVFETDFLHDSDLPEVDLSPLYQDFEESGVMPWDDEECELFLTRFVNRLPDGKYGREKDSVGEDPLVLDQPVVFLRKRRFGFGRDIDLILKGLDEGKQVPATIRNIVENDGERTTAARAVDEEILFPLPANNEQWQIVERLHKHTGVTVQGPPGTGKSHTIANFTSHFLAQGKKVLITAKAERPLRVLREMIPERIRSLCVSLFNDESGSMGELEQATRELTEKMASLDRGKAEENIVSLREQLKLTRAEIAKKRQRLKDISEQELATYNLCGQSVKLSELGAWLREKEPNCSWLPDHLPLDAVLPLSITELTRFYELAGRIHFQDRERLQEQLPSLEKLSEGNRLAAMIAERNALDTEVKRKKDLLAKWHPQKYPEPTIITGIKEQAQVALDELKKIHLEQWLKIIWQDTLTPGVRREAWQQLVQYLENSLTRLFTIRQQVSQYIVSLPGGITLNQLKDKLTRLLTSLGKAENIGVFHRLRYKKILSGCRLNDEYLRTKQDINVVLLEIERRQIYKSIANRWRNEVMVIAGPELKEDDSRFPARVDELIKKISKALSWKEKLWLPLEKGIEKLPIEKMESVCLSELQSLIETLNVMAKAVQLEQIQAQLRDIKAYLDKEEGNVQGFLWASLRDALEREDWKRWDCIRAEIERLIALEAVERQFQKLKDRLEAVAPLWAAAVSAQGGNGESLIPPENIYEAWEWRKAETWLQEILTADPVQLNRELEELQDQERRLVEELVATSTWLRVSRQVTEEQRRSLIAWQQHTRRIGKGTGKYAARNRRLAQKEMQVAREAVPVWIMPLNKVVESFSPWETDFDLVIVDESSQVDVFGILALFRGKQVLVVGDDKQISPQGVGHNLEAIHRLMATYLHDIPHGELLEPRYSLYDLAKQIYPGVIMLREHYRCLPEIIQYSNDLMYDGSILPLRQQESYLGEDWEPVKAIRVEEGYREPGRKINYIEAEALVDTLIACCQQDIYAGMTMGVISLLGDDQAQVIEEMLLDRLGPHEMRKRQIRCGDAYFFQGDERDIIFLSMVEAKEEGRRIAALTREDDKRRFNVAASRAKNQLWLFYSIDPEELNANDVRKGLIHYCCNPVRFQLELENEEDKCESDFERRVLRDLLRLGYSVKAQYQVGHKRIDFVIFGLKDRLAVECDGDAFHGIEQWEEDWGRQRDLERLGWKFHRIRGSAYYRDQEREIKKLVEVLDELGIEPRLDSDNAAS